MSTTCPAVIIWPVSELTQNPVMGSRIIESSPKIAHISELILSYHERWDGKGYPRGLKGKEIPYLSRLFSIINSYDAMTSQDILYRKPKTKEEAVEELKACAGTDVYKRQSRDSLTRQ